jgi:hypothetical protein
MGRGSNIHSSQFESSHFFNVILFLLSNCNTGACFYLLVKLKKKSFSILFVAGDITTEILDAPEFYYAEDYHQQYLDKNPDGYCGLGGTGVSCPIGLLNKDEL